jgi:hypothetical protein
MRCRSVHDCWITERGAASAVPGQCRGSRKRTPCERGAFGEHAWKAVIPVVDRTSREGENRHAISLNHDAYPRLRSMLAARSNSLAVGSAKSSASAYRVTTLNSAPTATASLRASALTPASSTAFAFSAVDSIGRGVMISKNVSFAFRHLGMRAARKSASAASTAGRVDS